jgi:hypothetical protein
MSNEPEVGSPGLRRVALQYARAVGAPKRARWHPEGTTVRQPTLLLLGLALAACGPPPAPSPHGPAALAAAESAFADLRAIRDRIEITTAAGRRESPEGVALPALARRHDQLRGPLSARLAAMDSTALATDDRRALAIMRAALAADLGPVSGSLGAPEAAESAPECGYDARAIAAAKGPDSLRTRVYGCYGWAQHHVIAGADSLDRLGVLAALAVTGDADRRRRLFLALDPVWRSVNGDDGPESPYRLLLTLEQRRRGGGESPSAERARALGLESDSLEQWLAAILEAWRAAQPDSLIEPWDWYYAVGQASRALGPRIPLPRLTELNAAVFRSLGADPSRLHVQYDLTPREGKTPVAFTTFGARPRRGRDGWSTGEPWVFATYRQGGLDALVELLHETGHAVHLAAIRTRPAFTDWPDSDPFTEALGDFVALDAYEPAWQMHWLGDSVPLVESLRARYAGIVLDVAWALFEVQVQRNPAADPNQVWTAITRDYLRIRPHPELSWWAMRGQLVDAPGYMMNYAAGAILIAAIRARTRDLHGSFMTGDSTWYGWVAPRLYRFGLERPSRVVIADFLGGPISPAAILADMRRMQN